MTYTETRTVVKLCYYGYNSPPMKIRCAGVAATVNKRTQVGLYDVVASVIFD